MMNGFHRSTTKQNFWRKKYTHPWHYTTKVACPQDKAVLQKPDFVSSNWYTVAIAIQKTPMSVILNITMCLVPQPGK